MDHKLWTIMNYGFSSQGWLNTKIEPCMAMQTNPRETTIRDSEHIACFSILTQRQQDIARSPDYQL